MKKALSTSLSNPRRFFWILIFTMIILGGLLSLGVFLFTPNVASANENLPVSLHSPLAADYSSDPRGLMVQAVGLEMLAQISQDRRGKDPVVPGDTLPTLLENLKTLVPTVTPSFPAPLASVSPLPTRTQPPASSPTTRSSSTSGPTTNTPLPDATPSATPGIRSATPTSLPSRTSVVQPSATRLPSSPTSEIPTATRVPPKITNTSEPPTNVPPTPVPPKATNTPIPTDIPPTPVPPRPTDLPPTSVPPTQPPPPTSYPPPPYP